MLSAAVCHIYLLGIHQPQTEFPLGLIIYRIWRSQRLIEQGRALLPIMVMIIESGAIYSAALISVIVIYTSGNNTQFLLLDFVRSGLFVISCAESRYIVLLVPSQLPSLMASL